MRSPLAALILLYVLAACTPRVMAPGPEIFESRIIKNSFMTSDGAALPVHKWVPHEPPKAVLLALHGFNDYGQFIDSPGKFFAGHGIITYAYDQRGFGATMNRGVWAGLTTYVRDATKMVHAMKRRHPDLPLYLLGSSMGGAVAMLAAIEMEPTSIDGLILAAPAIWGWVTMPWYQRLTLWISAHILPGITVTGRGLNVTPSDNREMLIRLGRDPLVIKETRIDAIYGLVNLMDAALAAAPALTTPTLILYGEKDEVIPKQPTGKMLNTLPQETHRIAIYSDGYHMLLRDLNAITVWEDIIAWIKDQNTSLPSKADQRSLKSLEILEIRQ